MLRLKLFSDTWKLWHMITVQHDCFAYIFLLWCQWTNYSNHSWKLLLLLISVVYSIRYLSVLGLSHYFYKQMQHKNKPVINFCMQDEQSSLLNNRQSSSNTYSRRSSENGSTTRNNFIQHVRGIVGIAVL